MENSIDVRKILLCIGSAEIGGAEKQLIRLAQEINQKENFDVTVWFLNSGGPLINYLEVSGIKYKIFNFSVKKLWKIGLMIKEIKILQPDIVNTYLVKNIFIMSFLKKYLKPSSLFVGSIRGINFKTDLFYKLLFNFALNSCEKIICNSQFLRDYLGPRYLNKSLVIKNGIEIKKRKNKSINTNKIVMISNFHSYKGFDLLLDSLNEVKVKCSLTIYGDTDSYANLEQYEKINRNVEIEFAGQIENIDDVDFEKFDFAVHPSRTEGLSNAIIEELAAGLPVIAFKVGGNSELIIDNQNGYLINPFDTKVFGEKINNLLENPKLIATLASNTDILIRDLSWKNVVNTHLNVYGL